MTRVSDRDARLETLREMLRGEFEEAPGWVQPSMRPSNKRRATVHQLKITLKGVKPPVWRRVVIPSSAALDETQFVLRDVFDAVGSVMHLEYDFGDGWDHDVLLEAVRLATKSESEPLCLGGKRACPPEDCGGSHGYDELLELLEYGPASDWDRERLEWLGGFDPEAFDADGATAWMRTAASYREWHE